MKIMVIMALSALDNKTRSLGGVDTVCQMQLEGIRRFGRSDCDYIVIAFNPANDLATPQEEHILADNLRLHWHNYARPRPFGRFVPNVVANEWLIYNYIKRYSPNVVHSHNPAWHISRYGDARKILTLHTYRKIARLSVGPFNNALHERLIQPYSIATADLVTTVSDEIARVLDGQLREPIRCIPNPINECFFSVTRALPPPPQVNLFMAGNIEPRKRTIDALAVLAALRPEYPNLHLRIAGRHRASDDYFRRFQEYIDANQLRGCVHFLGLLDQPSLLEELSRTHIGLSLSESETFGLAPLEMLAAGVPVITSEVGVFRSRKGAFEASGLDIVKPRDVSSFAARIKARLRDDNFSVDPALTRYLMQEFSLSGYMAQTEACYASSPAVREHYQSKMRGG
jgi:polysaccharide biosynthesis protein VpsD